MSAALGRVTTRSATCYKATCSNSLPGLPEHYAALNVQVVDAKLQGRVLVSLGASLELITTFVTQLSTLHSYLQQVEGTNVLWYCIWLPRVVGLTPVIKYILTWVGSKVIVYVSVGISLLACNKAMYMCMYIHYTILCV